MNTLSQKQEAFTLDYFKTEDPAPSYFNHYHCKSLAVASVGASNLLKKPKIQARLKELRDQLEKKVIEETIATKLEAGQVATEIMRARFSDFDLDNISREDLKSAAIREIKRTKGHSGKGKGYQSVTIKLESPLAAAEYLAKLYGWCEEQPPWQDNRQYNILVADDDTREEIKRLMGGEGRGTKLLPVDDGQ